MTSNLLKLKLSIAIAALALLAIPAMANAHAGNDDPNLLHVCIGNISKIVRSVGVSGACLAGPPFAAETAAHWDLTSQDGKDGANGVDGKDGTSVTLVDYFSGNANGCPNGGAIYAAGSPTVNTYVCNGTNGIDGKDGKDGLNATRADGSCFDNTNRYVDCGNGTVTDIVTGLIWLKQLDCLPRGSWAAASQAAAGLKNGDCGLTDNSAPSDWRLPTKDEWRATIARGVALGCTDRFIVQTSLTNNAGTDCHVPGPASPFADGSDTHWSSSSSEDFPNSAWAADLADGLVWTTGKETFLLTVWPVRSGSR